VTGGIGGVHRGAQSSKSGPSLLFFFFFSRPNRGDLLCAYHIRSGLPGMDISADLQQLSKTPMGVICAGAKSILDLGLTLEVLVSPPCRPSSRTSVYFARSDRD